LSNKEPLLGDERKRVNNEIMMLLNSIKDKLHDLSSVEKKIGTQEDTGALRRGM
jgi:hypothetical protein